jgi:hypothetical protein
MLGYRGWVVVAAILPAGVMEPQAPPESASQTPVQRRSSGIELALTLNKTDYEVGDFDF